MTATITTPPPPVNRKPKVCFSFAAYSKDLITHLHHHSNVPVAHGLTNKELSTIESTFNFSFPPDLRSILREGLPVGQGFPNWRSSSHQQLDILVNLPILGICKEVSRKEFWFCHWGDRPVEDDEAVGLAKRWLKRSPFLVPVYRNCYIPTIPCVYGNPIFFVHGSEVRVCSYDVVGLFHQIDYDKGVVSGMRLGHLLSAPIWAATEARRIEFWTEMAEICRVETRKKWWGGSQLGRCLDVVRLKLRDGGWKEEDLDEMMMVTESSSPSSVTSWSSSSLFEDDRSAQEDVVRGLSVKLLRGGWSMGDVVESLGCLTGFEDRTVEIESNGGGDSLFDLEHMRYSCVDVSQNV